MCGEMASWGDLGSHTGSKTAPSGGFPCGFNTVGRLRPLHEAGRRWAYVDVGPIE